MVVAVGMYVVMAVTTVVVQESGSVGQAPHAVCEAEAEVVVEVVFVLGSQADQVEGSATLVVVNETDEDVVDVVELVDHASHSSA